MSVGIGRWVERRSHGRRIDEAGALLERARAFLGSIQGHELAHAGVAKLRKVPVAGILTTLGIVIGVVTVTLRVPRGRTDTLALVDPHVAAPQGIETNFAPGTFSPM